MLDLGTLNINVVADTSKAQKQLNQFNGSIKEGSDTAKTGAEGAAIAASTAAATTGNKLASLTSKITTTGKKIQGIGSSMTKKFTVPIVGAFAASAKAASDYSENVNKVDVAFGKSSKVVKKWANTATTQFGLSRNAALEMTSLFGDMGTSMGLTQEKAAKLSTNMAGLAGDLASFKNISVDEAQTALEGVFTGETESLKKLGIVMTQTNLEDFAKKHGKVFSTMSEGEKVMLRYQYVMSKTKNAQGDYARTSDGTANSLRTLKSTISNLAVSFGSVLLPVITPIIQGFTKLMDKLNSLPAPIKTVIVIAALVVAAVGPVLSIIGSVMTNITHLINGVKMLGTAFSFLAANPIILLIAAIVALVAAFVLLYKHNEKFRKFVNGIASGVKEKFGAIITWIPEEIKGLITKIKGLGKFFKEIGKGLITLFFNGLKLEFVTIPLWIVNKIKGVVSKINGLGSDFKNAGINLIKSLWNGLKSIWSSISNWVSDKVGWLKDKIAFWKNNKDKAGGSGNTGGGNKHRTGLNSVPYDDYPALLHKGEMVLTQAEAMRYEKNQMNTPSDLNKTLDVICKQINSLRDAFESTEIVLNDREFARAVRVVK